jgi:hypothetical protein
VAFAASRHGFLKKHPWGPRLARMRPRAPRGRGALEADVNRHPGADLLRAVGIAIVVMLTSGLPAWAQNTRPPLDLWSEYPLEPVQTTPEPTPMPMPFIPPAARRGPPVAAPGTVITPDDASSRWLWPAVVAAVGLGAVGFLSIRRRLLVWDAAMYTRIHGPVRSATRALIVSLSDTADGLGLRHSPRELRRFSFPGGLVEAAGEPCAIRLVGRLRRRFVAEATRADQRRRRIAASRPFWRFLGAEQSGNLRGEVRRFAEIVGANEEEHVALLGKALGSRARRRPSFRFDDGLLRGRRFVRSALILEDAGVAAYNGQAANLTREALLAALRIVSVEGRHAAWIRDIAGEHPAPLAADPGLSASAVTTILKRARLLVIR